MTAGRTPARTLLVVLAIAASTPVVAQVRTTPPAPPAVQPAPALEPIGIRGYALAGMAALAARETFDAVAGARSRPAFGGGVQITNLWRRLFADVGASVVSFDGGRVFVDDGRVFELGIPLEVTLRHLDVAGGWRLTFARGRISPYAGAGLTWLQYEETSAFAQPGDDVREGGAGALVLGGVDIRLWQWLHAGGELRYRRVGGILGEGGASAAFGEDDAGGVAAAVRISVGR